MANQKNAAKKKKPTAAAQSKKAASAKRTNTKARKGKSAVKADKSRTSPDAVRQRTAIVLLAVAVLFIAAVFIKGEHVWLSIHNLIFGLFGVSAYVWPLILIYIAIVIALNRSMISVRSNIIGASLFSLLFSGVIHVFSPAAAAGSLKEQIEFVWNLRQHVTINSGGFFGAVFGGIPYAMFGKTGAAVFLIVLLVVTFMFVTGTSLLGIYLFLKDSVEKAESIREKYREMDSDEDSNEVVSEEPLRKRKKKFVPIDINPEAESKDAIIIEELVGNASKKELEPNVKEPKVFTDVSSGKKDNENIDDIIKKVNSGNKSDRSEKKVKVSVSKKTDKADTVEKSTAKNNKVNSSDIESSDARNAFKTYEKPPVECLLYADNANSMNYEDELKTNAKKLVDTLDSFGVSTKIVDISRGPSVTRYELQPAAGVKISKITGLSDDIALALAASGVRIEAPIPNKSAVGIEIPNKKRAIVSLREIIETPIYKNAKSKLNVALGKDITGNVICADLAKMPHLLIAGTTGSGKSVCLNSMIVSILYNADPDEVKLVMIDPKQVEFTVYSGIPHLLVPVVSDPRKAAGALGWAVTEMLQRYKMFSEKAVRDIKGYNKLAATDETITPMPHIVIFIDELSDLMMAAPNEVEDSICRLAQMARAAGMHLVIATQRPSVNVITGIIKANIPSRIALSVSSQVDSRTIIDTSGAEKLLGYGDMLFSPVGISKPVRVQGCYLSDEEVEDVVKFIKSQTGEKKYDEEVMQEIERQSVIENKKKATTASGDDEESSGDEMVPRAIEVVVEAQMASTTLLQRKLKLGYARAARIVDELEERGIIGPFEGSKPRKVLISKQQWMEMNALANAAAPIENPIEQESSFEDDEEITEDEE